MQPGGRCRYRSPLAGKDRLIAFAIIVGCFDVPFDIRRQRRVAYRVYRLIKRPVEIELNYYLSVVAFFNHLCGQMVLEANHFSRFDAFAGPSQYDPVSSGDLLDKKQFYTSTGFGTAEKPGRENLCVVHDQQVALS